MLNSQRTSYCCGRATGLRSSAHLHHAGISGKTQILFLIVYITRYLDVFFSFISLYNTSMKIMFVGASSATVYMIYGHKAIAPTYDRHNDTFKIELVLIPTLLLALLPHFHYAFTLLEVLWAFSIYLEALAIMPQLFMLTKTGNAETITSHYLFALGAYRAFYIMNWVYRCVVRIILPPSCWLIQPLYLSLQKFVKFPLVLVRARARVE
jgi:hypothetical protein